MACHCHNCLIVIKSKGVWSCFTKIIHCKPSHGTARKNHRTLTATRQQKDNYSKATSSFFLNMTTAYIERTQSNYMYKQGPITQHPQTNGRYISTYTEGETQEHRNAYKTHIQARSRGYITCLCSTQLSLKFTMLNVKMLTIPTNNTKRNSHQKEGLVQTGKSWEKQWALASLTKWFITYKRHKTIYHMTSPLGVK